MGKVSQETQEQVHKFFQNCEGEIITKCSICKETLTHMTKLAEVETGAGTDTVCKILADQINQHALPQDRVTAKALSNRVRRHEGKDSHIPPKRENKDSTIHEKDSFKKEINLTSSEFISKMISARETVVALMIYLAKMAKTHKLSDDRLFKEVENQIRLIITEANELGIRL